MTDIDIVYGPPQHGADVILIEDEEDCTTDSVEEKPVK